ncbi:hypothetical protein EWM64_g2216 [Hericium alpestre]|uniref:VHS domain-containing protein n=1 Tax=Hericium alpestre TaxID=135208 RepID=A0A4Z0A5Z4_9AGAM|nr:hypothetical protein EWM64_g2216 [Hericium alpestre]
MSTISNWLWGTSQLDDAVDRATSELLPAGAEDIALNLEICDQIRSKSAQPKDAARALKRRLNHKNPNVQLLALNLLDVCIKNGGDHFLVEVASKDFMDNLVSILKLPVLNRDVKIKILRYLQTWAIAFEGKPSLSYVGQLSLEEVHGRQHGRPGYVPYQPEPSTWQTSEPPLVDRASRPPQNEGEEDDPDLKAAIEASLREANAPKPSAPIAVETPRVEQAPSFAYPGAGYSQSYPPTAVPSQPQAPALPNYDLEALESDTILTFSQTVEQVQAQGGRDMSRYPAVTQLYEKANSLRPKLAMSLDDSGRKEEMLTEMHEKLSQAVKLYDKLLTEQLSRPTWRAAPAPQRADSAYGHWNPAHTPASPAAQYTPQQQQASSSYAPPAQQTYQTPVTSEMGYHQQAAPPQSWSQYSEPTTTAQPYEPQVPYASHPAPAPQFQPMSPQYAQYQPVSIPPPAAPPAHVPAPPISIPQPPPLQIHVQSPVLMPSQPPSSSLARHNTVQSYTVASPPPINSGLARHNTVATPHGPSAQLPQFSAPTPMPDFPSVPTSVPQVYPAYSNAIPAGVEQTEKKEALLIDL